MVAVPQVVVYRLVVPHPLAGAGVKGQDAVGVEVIPGAVTAVEVVGGRARRYVHDAPLVVHTHTGPGVGPAVIPLRQGAKQPAQLPRMQVEGADVSRCRPHVLAYPAPHDDQVFKDHPRAGRDHELLLCFLAQAGVEVHAASLPEAFHLRPRPCIQGVEVGAGGVVDARLLTVGPVIQSPIGAHAEELVGENGGVEGPQLLPGGRVEGKGLQLGIGTVKYPIHHQRVTLDLAAVEGIEVARGVGPGYP